MFGAGLLTDCGLKFDNQKYSFVGLGFEPAASLIHSNNSTGGNMVRNNARLNSQKTGKAFYVCFALIFLFSLVGVQPAQDVMAQTETKVAVITDFGVAISDSHKANIATLVTNWDPDAVVTGGDNYHDREPSCTSYAECIAGYNNSTAGYTDYVTAQTFFPAYGNHDANHSSAYISYFSYLPSTPDTNHLFYDVVVGDIHFWVLNGNVTLSGSAQQTWLAANVPTSTSPWNIAVVHQAPYGTGFYGDLTATQIPYQDYGVDFVISGHNHHYERLVKDGVRYFIAGRAGVTEEGRTCDGTGSSATTEFCAGTQTPALDNFGYMQIVATETIISFKFLDEGGIVRDTYEQTTEEPTDPVISVSPSSLAFTSQTGEFSEIKSYTVSGVRLQGNVTITPPSDFEISTTGGTGFTPTNPITLNPTSETLAETTIYARFKRATAGSSTGNISHTSLNATMRNVAVSGMASESAGAEWVAYNDMSGSSTPANTTEFSLDDVNGMLLDFDSGAETGVTVTVTSDGGPYDYTTGGEMPASGTDANTIFNGKVDLQGVIMSATSNPVDYWVDLTFNNLIPTKTYTFAATANRAGTSSADPPYDERTTRYTISGMDASVNASSSGVTVIDPNSVYFVTGNNSSAGYVAKWVNIQPGSDGSFTVRAQPQDPENPRTYTYGGFMLQQESVQQDTYSLSVSSVGNGSVTLNPTGGTYTAGTQVTLTPVPGTGYEFDSWSGEDYLDLVDQSNGSWTILMDEDRVLTANFTEIPNNAPTDILLSNSSVMEGQAAGTLVGTLSTVDADTGDTFTYSLVAGTGDTDNASFTISGNQLLSAEEFDYETKDSYSIRVQVSDSGSLTFAKALTITILPSGVTPPLPSNFYGEIHFMDGDGGPAVDDQVEAYLDDETTPIWSVAIEYYSESAPLVYAINVPAYPDGTNPVTVTFKIDGRIVAVADWVSGTNVELNLHPPKADAGGPYVTLASAGSVSLAGAVSDWENDVVSRNWDLDEDGAYDDSSVLNPSFSFTSAGTYPVSLKVVDAQDGEGYDTSQVFAISLSGLTGQVYNGSTHPVTVAGVESPFTYAVQYGGSATAPTNAGTYSVLVQILSGTEVIGTYVTEMVIAKATATITLANLNHTYDGTTKAASATTNPSGLSVNISYNPTNPVNAGSYAVTATINDSNYEGTNTGTLVISKATATVNISNLSQQYDGSPKPVTVTTNPIGLAVTITYNGSTTVPSQPGDYAVVATINESNYEGTASATLVIIGLSQAIDLEPGWNLVSFNISPTSTAIADVLESIAGEYSLVYAWDANSTANPWLRFDPNVGYGNTLTTLDETMGFWIYMSQEATLTVFGTQPVTTEIDLSITAGGWNLIGFPALDSADLPDVLSTIEEDYTLIFAYHAADTSDPWKVFDIEAPIWSNDLTQMAPGWGYWIFVTDNTTLVIPYE